jgi:uncharacterized protein
MSPTIRYIIFISVVTALTGGVHYYLWTRLVRDPGLKGPWGRLATGLLIALALCMFVGPLLGRVLGGEASRLWATAAFSWMGALMLLMILLSGGELARLAARAWFKLNGNDMPLDPDRRVLLARLIGGGAAVGALGLSGIALAAASRPPKVVRVEVPLDRLPASMDGFRVVQISDLHVSATIRRPYVEKVVAMTNELQPDLVVLTGDLMDGSVEMLRDDFAPLGNFKSIHGTFAVTGNHEYYSGADRWIAHFNTLGIKTLRNEHVAIGESTGSVAGFDLAGIDDSSAHRFGGDHGADLSAAVKGRDPRRELVLLAHQPRQVADAPQHGVGLQLSGHTHGGQIWPWGWVVRLVQPYVAGLHKHAANTWIYVSRGTGYWGPPMRLGAQHELTLLTLKSTRPT